MASVCSLLAAVCVFVFCGGSALAATGHKFLSRLSEAPPGTALKAPGAAAVDHATGDVFVADPASGVVDVFGATGAFVTQFGEGLEPAGVAVDEASGNVYVADSATDAVLVFKPNGSGGYVLLASWSGEGTAGKEFGEVVGVGVDNSKSVSAGDVYVVDREDPLAESGVVDVLSHGPKGLKKPGKASF